MITLKAGVTPWIASGLIAILSLAGCTSDHLTNPPSSSSSGGGGSSSGGSALPDLVPTMLPNSTSGIKCGTSITFPLGTIVVENMGTKQANPPVRVDVGLWDGSSSSYWIVHTWSDFSNNTIWYPGNKWLNAAFTTQIGCNVPAGYYHWTVFVDPGNTVQESNEGNNQKFGSSTFYLSH